MILSTLTEARVEFSEAIYDVDLARSRKELAQRNLELADAALRAARARETNAMRALEHAERAAVGRAALPTLTDAEAT